MFVLVDMEWITNAGEYQSPTQISAVRLNEDWSVISQFDSFIKPRDSSFHDWLHVAYRGGRPIDFLCADNAYTVFLRLRNWLEEDDILLWWHNEAEKLFRKLTSIILKQPEQHKSICINKYVYSFLSGQKYSSGSPYRIAEKRGINTLSYLQHNSKNDVRVLRELMSEIKYPQQKLLEPLPKPVTAELKFRYAYIPETKTVHDIACPYITEVDYLPYTSIKTAVKKGGRPCRCCKEDFYTVLRIRNLKTIQKTEYNYIYTEISSVFHKRTCSAILCARSILGTVTYEGVLKTGKRPCKLCNPSAADFIKPIEKKRKAKREEFITTLQPTESISRALNRQKVAREERARLLKETNLTENEKNDIYTLTQTRFAFWVGQGCNTFHIHSCAKIKNLQNIQGFATYKDAVSAGFSPCRKCKPTVKHDALLSVPFTNKVRKDESPDILELFCDYFGLPYKKESNFFYLETPVGKWKIDTNSHPIRIEHINLVKNPYENSYHCQPRLFLSFTDTFNYIKRHDDELTKRSAFCLDNCDL